MRWKILVAAAAVATLVLGGYTGAAGAATGTRTVTNAVLRDGEPDLNRPFLWYRFDTRTGGGVGLTTDFGDPDGATNESLALTTNHLTTAKAQLYNTQVNGTSLGSISSLSYNTYHDSDTTGFENGNAALQLVIDYNGGDFGDGGFTTLTYEPYLNGTVTPDVWQPWETTEGDYYTSRAITCGDYTLPSSQGSPEGLNSLAEIAAGCPDAYVAVMGVNIGSNNPNYVVGVDGIHITSAQDDLTWNFGTGAK
jgi:hypothetical protein